MHARMPLHPAPQPKQGMLNVVALPCITTSTPIVHDKTCVRHSPYTGWLSPKLPRPGPPACHVPVPRACVQLLHRQPRARCAVTQPPATSTAAAAPHSVRSEKRPKPSPRHQYAVAVAMYAIRVSCFPATSSAAGRVAPCRLCHSVLPRTVVHLHAASQQRHPASLSYQPWHTPPHDCPCNYAGTQRAAESAKCTSTGGGGDGGGGVASGGGGGGALAPAGPLQQPGGTRGSTAGHAVCGEQDGKGRGAGKHNCARKEQTGRCVSAGGEGTSYSMCLACTGAVSNGTAPHGTTRTLLHCRQRTSVRWHHDKRRVGAVARRRQQLPRAGKRNAAGGRAGGNGGVAWGAPSGWAYAS